MARFTCANSAHFRPLYFDRPHQTGRRIVTRGEEECTRLTWADPVEPGVCRGPLPSFEEKSPRGFSWILSVGALPVPQRRELHAF